MLISVVSMSDDFSFINNFSKNRSPNERKSEGKFSIYAHILPAALIHWTSGRTSDARNRCLAAKSRKETEKEDSWLFASVRLNRLISLVQRASTRKALLTELKGRNVSCRSSARPNPLYLNFQEEHFGRLESGEKFLFNACRNRRERIFLWDEGYQGACDDAGSLSFPLKEYLRLFSFRRSRNGDGVLICSFILSPLTRPVTSRRFVRWSKKIFNELSTKAHMSRLSRVFLSPSVFFSSENSPPKEIKYSHSQVLLA